METADVKGGEIERTEKACIKGFHGLGFPQINKIGGPDNGNPLFLLFK